MRFRQRSYFWRLLYAFLAGGLVPFILLATVFLSTSTRTLENTYRVRAAEAVSLAAVQTRQLFAEAGAVAQQLSHSEFIRDYVGNVSRNPRAVSEINRIFSSAVVNPAFIPYIIPLDGSDPIARTAVPEEYRPLIYGGWGILGELGRKCTEPGNAWRSIVVFFGQPHSLSGSAVPFAVGVPVYSYGILGGYVIIDISRQEFSERVGLAAGSGGALTELFLVDRSGFILYSMSDLQFENTFIDSVHVSGPEFFLSRQEIGEVADIYGKYPVSALQDYISQIALLTLIIALVSFFSTLALAIFLSRSLARPVHLLTLTMEKIEQGQLDAACPELPGKGAGDEIAVLIHRFNRMIVRVRELVANLVAQERDLRRAETQALQAQINPHFLYNTLNSIRSMAKLDGAKDIADMTTSLARIMREGSFPGTGFCSVEHSLALARDYFAIESWRWPGRFRLEESVSAEILRARIPRLIIQPVVENALVHGLEEKPGNGVLSISARREGDDVVLVISDTGTGIESGRLAQVREKLKEAGERPVESSLNEPSGDAAASRDLPSPMRGTGIALINTHRRLCLIYGKPYGLDIDSTRGEGTSVTIRFPYVRAEEE